jgi:hypothetical protein
MNGLPLKWLFVAYLEVRHYQEKQSAALPV